MQNVLYATSWEEGSLLLACRGKDYDNIKMSQSMNYNPKEKYSNLT